MGPSSPLVVLLGVAGFVAPILVWRRYASAVASPGGLYSFVEAAAGRRVALAHGAVWTVSYFLYLPSTVAQVVYEIIPAADPALARVRPLLEVAIPLVMVAGLVGFRLGLLSVTALAAAALLPLAGVLGWVQLAHAGASASGLRLHVPALQAARGAGSLSLLYVCASLPLYFGGELRRPRRRTARALPLALGVGAAASFAAALSFDRLPAAALGGVVPGATAAAAFSGPVLAKLVIVGTAVSLLTLVLLELVALTRLLTAMAPLRPRGAELAVGGAFVVSAIVSLVGPDATYEKLLQPSLVALYLSQVVVFVVYPLFRRRQGRLRRHDFLLAAVASALMGYGVALAVAPGAVS